MSHFKELCSCGIVLAQCRCAGKKTIINSQVPCTHREKGPDDDRIKSQYKRLKKGLDQSGDYPKTKGEIFLKLAQQWKRPVKDIKQILGQ